MMMRTRSVPAPALLSLLAALAALTFASCSPVPRRALSPQEKALDLQALDSIFQEFYAPLRYKEGRRKLEYGALKSAYLARAQATTTNEQFYDLLHEFVAEFQDAHTAGQLNDGGTPERAKIAVLGFTGKRKGDALVVTELLPTIDVAASDYPIQPGDLILALDGLALPEAVRAQLVKFRHLGQDEGNLTFHMPALFTRSTLRNGLPAADEARLKVRRSDKEFEVTLPWAVQDLATFSREQAEAEARKKKTAAASTPLDELSTFDLARMVAGGNAQAIVELFAKASRASPIFDFASTFRLVDPTPGWDSAEATRILREAAARQRGVALPPRAEGAKKLAKEREIPEHAIVLAEAKTYPGYLTLEQPTGADGKASGAKRLVAYIRVDTFSPDEDETVVIREFRSVISRLQANGVRDLVIDLIDNGGGSLRLGAQMAQALSGGRIAMPEIEFRANDGWIDQFEADAARQDSSDVNRAIARRVARALREDQAQGRWLSRRFSVETLFPLAAKPNLDVAEPFRIVLMVNELCASMCDIFTAMLKDNGMAKVVGAQTLGAGGNVVTHLEQQLPGSHFIVNQTESLIVRSSGAYLENEGVVPDVAMRVHEGSDQKYEPVRRKALETLLRAP